MTALTMQAGVRLAQLAHAGVCARHEMLDLLDLHFMLAGEEHNRLRREASSCDDSDDDGPAMPAGALQAALSACREVVVPMIQEHLNLTGPGACPSCQIPTQC